MINSSAQDLSVLTQCKILEIPRSSIYYKSKASEISADLLNEISELNLAYPQFGYRRITIMLQRKGYKINKKKVQRLMKLMGIEALYCRPYTSIGDVKAYKHPYLLEGLKITKANQVWATDITYIKMPRGFSYLTALLDLHSRYIVAWKLSIGLQVDFCLEMLSDALANHGAPEIINTDQGSQYTSSDWVGALAKADIKISMDGKGRWVDNVLMERFWRTTKQEQIYINPPDNMIELRGQMSDFIIFYNNVRPHMSLNYQTPEEVYFGKKFERGTAM